MKNRLQITIVAITCLIFALPASAQRSTTQALINAALHGWEYEIKAGFGIGGSAPLPLPAEIRSIDSYNPTLAISLEGTATKWFGEKQKAGLSVGFRMENKNMTTKATTKNYSMEIIGSDGNRLKGNWTGGVKTKVRNSYLTLPILAAYKISSRWNIKFGPYFSYLMDKEFSGEVYDGYLREGNPTGDKIKFEDGAIATYDFSGELRKFQWGLQLGADWKAFKHLKVFTDLTWGLNDIFKDDFKTVTFDMYPIYLNMGFAYAF